MKKLILPFVVFFFLWSCTKDEPIPVDPKLKPSINSVLADNITADGARLTAMIVPNGKDVIVTIEYSEDGVNWTRVALEEKFNGDVITRASKSISGLKFSTLYSYRFSVANTNGVIGSDPATFTTLKPLKSAAAIRPVEAIRINEACLTAMLIPRFDNTTAAFEYSADKANWQSVVLPDKFSGNDSIRVKTTLSGLIANTIYSYRLRVSNIAGDTISATGSFKTYAFKDYDGNYYHTVTIGTQTWMQEDLKATHYLNGDPIPNLTDTAAWLHSTSGAYVYYNNDAKMGEVYGCLYNWYAGADSRGLIAGYHVPSGDEWVTLANFVGSNYSGLALREAGGSHWKIPNGNNSSGFTALPGGFCGILLSTGKFGFANLGDEADYWTSWSMGNLSVAAYMEPAKFSMLDIGTMYKKNYGFSLRLIKD